MKNLILKTLLVFLFGCSIACNQDNTIADPAEDLLQKSCSWLWAQQKADGGWHSETHGILKGGESLTAFILWHLLEVDNRVFQKQNLKVKSALDFLRSHVSENGALGLSDPQIVDYPNYSTAYALRIFAKYGEENDQNLVEKMTRYLLAQQFTEQRGISPEHLAYGAWGFGETNLEAGATGHVDLSHTRRILESLRIVGVQDSSVFKKAQSFLLLLQKNPKEKRLQPDQQATNPSPYDGGFYASSVTTSTNKAVLDSLGYYPSYATATSDGLLALLASGFSLTEEPVQKASQWLRNHPRLNRPEGIPTDDPYQWHKVMFYYHLAVRAEAMAALGEGTALKNQMVDILKAKQFPEGYFVNPDGSLNKEDDPLLATAFGIIALQAFLGS